MVKNACQIQNPFQALQVGSDVEKLEASLGCFVHCPVWVQLEANGHIAASVWLIKEVLYILP